MLYHNIMMSCASCLAGHRAGPCQHTDRPLFAIKNKGRGTGGSSRSSHEPDFPQGIRDPAVLIFHQAMMQDEKMYREYYHATPGNQATPRQQITAPCSRKQKSGGGRVDDMYSGSLNPEQVTLWRQLCGYAPITTTVFSDPDANVLSDGPIPPPPVETPITLQPDFELPSFMDIPSANNFDFMSDFFNFEGMTTNDSVATLDPIPETVDVIEAQRQHPHLRLPIAWSSQINSLSSKTLQTSEMREETLPEEGAKDDDYLRNY